MQKKFTESGLLAGLGLLSIYLAYSHVWPTYKTYVKNSWVQFGILVLLVFLVKKLAEIAATYHKNAPVSLLIVPITLLGYYTSYSATLVNILLIALVYLTGARFKIVLNLKSQNFFISFILGYGLLANLLYIPYFTSKIRFDLFYPIVIAIIVIFLISDFRSLVERTKEEIKLIAPQTDSVVITYLFFLMLSAALLSFGWDDLNHYLYLPLRSLIEGHSVLSAEIPGSLTFLSYHNLSYLTFAGWMLSSNNYEIAFVYKQFNALSYCVSFFCLYSILFSYLPERRQSGIIFLIIVSSSIWFVQVTSNYTDFPLLLLSIYTIYVLFESADAELEYFHQLLVCTLFLSISLKLIVLIIPLLALNLRKRYTHQRALASIVILLPVTPVFVRNYLLTGNPTFPAGNQHWKSDFFYTDPLNIVVSKYKAPWAFDPSLFFNFLSNAAEPVKLFYGSEPVFYSPLFFALVSLLIFCTLLVKNFSFRTNDFIRVSVVVFILVVLFPGAQYRYFIPVFVLLSVGFVLAISQVAPLQSCSLFQNRVFSCVVPLLISLSFVSPYTGLPLKTSNGTVFSDSGKDWNSKINFYGKVNDYFSLGNLKDYKIMIFYLQDKIFLNQKRVYEYDWYDYANMIRVKKAIDDPTTSGEVKDRLVTETLCSEGYRYMILSQVFWSDNFMNTLTPVILDNSQALYRINCSTR
jgi:hypothetical protein